MDSYEAGIVAGAILGWIVGIFTPIIVYWIAERIGTRRTDREILESAWTYYDEIRRS